MNELHVIVAFFTKGLQNGCMSVGQLVNLVFFKEIAKALSCLQDSNDPRDNTKHIGHVIRLCRHGFQRTKR